MIYSDSYLRFAEAVSGYKLAPRRVASVIYCYQAGDYVGAHLDAPDGYRQISLSFGFGNGVGARQLLTWEGPDGLTEGADVAAGPVISVMKVPTLHQLTPLIAETKGAEPHRWFVGQVFSIIGTRGTRLPASERGPASARSGGEGIGPGSYVNDSVVRRIALDNAVPLETARLWFDEMLKFLDVATAAYGDDPGLIRSSPSWPVDAAWHAFILHTRAYADYCERLCGRFVNHTPHSEEQRSASAEKGFPDYLRTREAVRQRFGEIDPELWPDP
jgi:hypothetical protein